jgi:hypothetical protein
LDSLGNVLDEQYQWVKPDGSTQSLTSVPPQLEQIPVTYFPNHGEVYFLEGNQLIKYDLNFTKISSYNVPPGLRLGGTISIFIGYDMGLYVFDTTQKILTKFLIPGLITSP